MFRRAVSLTFIALMLNLALCQISFAGTKEEKLAEKVKTSVLKLGVGPDVRVEVHLKDKTKIKGYISEADENGFVVVNASGEKTPVPYPSVKKMAGKNITKHILIFVGMMAAAILIVALLLSTDKS